MTIQFTLLIISFLLIIMFALFIWVIRLTIKRKIMITESAVENKIPITHQGPTEQVKYARSRLEETDKEAFVKEIILHLEMKKAYRQPDLSIAQLAKQTKIPKHHVSQVINEKMNTSFLDFINGYRVAEAQEKLQAAEYQKLSIVEIGKSVGFSAKSTFYAVFKKYTNSTPGDYRKAMSMSEKIEFKKK